MELLDAQKFELEWRALAEQICLRIYQTPEVQAMKADFDANGRLSFEQKSRFIAIANEIKYEAIYEKYGVKGSDGFKNFTRHWQHWFENKGLPGEEQQNRKITNSEHIIYSSTPDPEEFIANFRPL